MDHKTFSGLMALVIERAPAIVRLVRRACDRARYLDFLAPLLLRLYLAPVFWMAGTKKFANFSDTADWFGNSEWGLGLPMPYLLVFLVALLETLGALFLLFGFATRLMSLPLMVIMVFAALTTHWSNGWLAVATGSGIFANDRTMGAMERLEQAKQILQSQGDYQWLTEHGNLVVLNNGIEFAATYFVMLLVLFFIGGGRFISVDYWLVRKYFND
ncbi:DoxX family protein [Methylomonas sp. LL1]|uniref:HvfX family Cu-binding RiPP maturation protein n=1 Tax=Methylomonas sp. LL1 TaxID=2785785 RepID=UPI0018C3EF19|nr:DoxX family protein [Methylomonas sp. LL1]QPK63667.1 DoxX family protein [Methylomonas sp. LL1]